MTREILINQTVETLSKLPHEKIVAVSDFANYISQKYEEEILQRGIEKLMDESEAFAFLKDEEDLYTLDDLEEVF